MHIAVPDKLARAGDIRCATRDPKTGAIWMGAKAGALVFRPRENEWRHVRLKDASIDACGHSSCPPPAWRPLPIPSASNSPCQ